MFLKKVETIALSQIELDNLNNFLSTIEVIQNNTENEEIESICDDVIDSLMRLREIAEIED